MSGVRATKSAESRRGYLDLDTHLEYRAHWRAIQNRRRGLSTVLRVQSVATHDAPRVPWANLVFGWVVVHVPEPWQAPA